LPAAAELARLEGQMQALEKSFSDGELRNSI
jgi:hypothetical protein